MLGLRRNGEIDEGVTYDMVAFPDFVVPTGSLASCEPRPVSVGPGLRAP